MFAGKRDPAHALGSGPVFSRISFPVRYLVSTGELVLNIIFWTCAHVEDALRILAVQTDVLGVD